MSYPVEFFETVNNTVPRFNGEQGRIKASGVAIDDADNLLVPNGIIFGGSGVSLRYKRISGYTSSIDGGTAAILHELDKDSIVFFNVMVSAINSLIPPNFEGLPDYEYNAHIDNLSIHISNYYMNCNNILNTPFNCLIAYSV